MAPGEALRDRTRITVRLRRLEDPCYNSLANGSIETLDFLQKQLIYSLSFGLFDGPVHLTAIVHQSLPVPHKTGVD
jgi:hypothetical protein